MQIVANSLEIKKLFNGNTELTFEVEDRKSKIAENLGNCQKLKDGKLEVSIEKFYPKRSLNQNKLFWAICEELSEHINDTCITAQEIYRGLIREYGVSTIMPVEDDILNFVLKAWEGRGDGWIAEPLRKSKLDGNYTAVKFWFGSSIYNSKMFSKLVEGLKITCKDNGLDISHYDERLQALIKSIEEKENSAMQSKEESAMQTNKNTEIKE